MPRLLSEKDRAMLRKIAPECDDIVCAGSGVPFRSLLPPVANHFASGPDDFGVRLARLDDDDLRTLVGLIETGEESLGCVPPAYADVLISLLATRLGPATAGRVFGVYEASAACEERGI